MGEQELMVEFYEKLHKGDIDDDLIVVARLSRDLWIQRRLVQLERDPEIGGQSFHATGEE